MELLADLHAVLSQFDLLLETALDLSLTSYPNFGPLQTLLTRLQNNAQDSYCANELIDSMTIGVRKLTAEGKEGSELLGCDCTSAAYHQ